GANAELQRKESSNRPRNNNTAVYHNRNVYHRLRQSKGPITSRNSAIRLNPFLIYFYRCMEATRQLAAIMFTDMEGYTALMQKNEQEAIERRNRHRQVFEKAMSDHGGKIIQYYGDGTLSIFSSAIHAVKAGVAMQLLFRKA